MTTSPMNKNFVVVSADFLGSVYVLMCVVLTLVDLCGYMHFWGLTIDVVSSVNVIIAIGTGSLNNKLFKG